MYLSTIFKIAGNFYTGNVKATAVFDVDEIDLWYIKHELVTLIKAKDDIKTSNEYVTLHQYLQMFTGAMKDRCTNYDPEKIAIEIYKVVNAPKIWVNPKISDFTVEDIQDML